MDAGHGRRFWRHAIDSKLSQEQVERLFWWFEHGNRYHERPVPVRQFLFGPTCGPWTRLGEPVLWPRRVDAIERVCTGPYVESI